MTVQVRRRQVRRRALAPWARSRAGSRRRHMKRSHKAGQARQDLRHRDPADLVAPLRQAAAARSGAAAQGHGARRRLRHRLSVARDPRARWTTQGRIIAIDPSSPMLDEARTKAGRARRQAHLLPHRERRLPKLSFADDVYDLVVCNAGLQEFDDPERAIREFARVAKPGGRVAVTLPLAGTFGEFYDLYPRGARQARSPGRHRSARRLPDALSAARAGRGVVRGRRPRRRQAASATPSRCCSSRAASSSSRRSSSTGRSSTWKAIAGKGQQMQDVFWHFKSRDRRLLRRAARSPSRSTPAASAGARRSAACRRRGCKLDLTSSAAPEEPSRPARSSSSPATSTSSASRRSSRQLDGVDDDEPDGADLVKRSMTREDYEALARELQEHDRRYYVDNDPTITDVEYDRLLPAAARDRGRAPGLDRRLVADPARRARAGLGVPQGRARGADAVARQHLRRGRAARVPRARRARASTARRRPTWSSPRSTASASSSRTPTARSSLGATRGDGVIGEDVTRQPAHHPRAAARARRAGDRRRARRGLHGARRLRALNAERVAAGEEPCKNPRNSTAARSSCSIRASRPSAR